MLKTFGKKPSGESLKRMEASPNYKEGAFQNIEPTSTALHGISGFGMMKKFMNKPKTVKPSRRIPSVKTDLKSALSDTPRIVWFGHSSYFIESKGFTILVDPVFSGNASPFSFFAKAFDGANEYSVDNFPEIDLLILTHDHYDHLDHETIKKLKTRVKRVITPLGVGEHLIYWGYSPALIKELDWWQNEEINANIRLTSTPARHFSGRSFKRNVSLWTSYVLELHGYKIFLGGDSGYDGTFRKIGGLFGPFDLAILECGQYGVNWPYIHMFPEQMAQAAIDLKAKVLLPVHWAKFTLSLHPWNEPIKRLLKAADEHRINVTTPKIGEPYHIGAPLKKEVWWDFE